MKKTTLSALYSFPGFRAQSRLKDDPDDPGGRTIGLRRRQKKLPAPVGVASDASTIASRTRGSPHVVPEVPSRQARVSCLARVFQQILRTVRTGPRASVP